MPAKSLIAILLAATPAACGGDDEDAQPNPPDKRVKSAQLGEGVVLRTQSGEALRAKVARVFDPVRDHRFEDARIAGRFVGIELRLKNQSEIPHRGSPWSGSRLSTTEGAELPTKMLKQGSCIDTVRRVIAPGARERLCIPFRVDPGAELLKFRYAPEAGFAPAAGVWDLRP